MPRSSNFVLAMLYFAVPVMALIMPAPGAQPEKQGTPKDDTTVKTGVVITHRSKLSDEDLRKQLLAVPEVGFNQLGAAGLYASMKQSLKQTGDLPLDFGMKFFAQAVPGI